MRLLKPTGENSVFRNAGQNAVGADYGSILRARENKDTHQHHEPMKKQFQAGRPDQVHGNAADEVGEIIRPNLIGNNHHGKERDQGSEQQAVNENDEPSLLQILQLGMFDLAVDLGQSLFAAHGEDGVSEADKKNDPGNVAEPGSVEPAQ